MKVIERIVTEDTDEAPAEIEFVTEILDDDGKVIGFKRVPRWKVDLIKGAEILSDQETHHNHQ